MKFSIKRILKSNSFIMNTAYIIARIGLDIIGSFIPVEQKSMIFVSFSGRRFDDSPKAIYEEVCRRDYFKDWDLIWAFKNPESYHISRGTTIHFGSKEYWLTLLKSRVWIDNGGIDLGLDLNRKRNLAVHTWHGTVLKWGYGHEKKNPVLAFYRKLIPKDSRSIRCIQTENEIDVCVETFKAAPDTFLRCGLPRNDCLLNYTEEHKREIKRSLGIPENKKVILYMPTFRAYVQDENHEYCIKPPINVEKWKTMLGDQYVLLIRTHYMISNALNLVEDSFIHDVSKYEPLSDLYVLADILISDYSSCMFDFSILEKPIRCFGYDYDEYIETSGLVYDLPTILPRGVMKDEDEVIASIVNIDYATDCELTRVFKSKYAEYFHGDASKRIVDEIERRLQNDYINN